MLNLCDKCNAPLTGRYKHRSKYCSLECAQSNKKIICDNCKKEFRGRSRDKYCSKKCLKEFNFKNPPKISLKGLRKGSNKIGMDTFQHPVFGWVRNVYDEKVCGSCKKNKKYDQFRKLKTTSKTFKGGNGFCGRDKNLYISQCRDCENENFMKRYRNNPVPQLFYNFRKRAEASKVPFDLTKEDIKKLLEEAGDKCPVLGIKFIQKADKNTRDYSPSVDRIDPKKGYTKNNTIVVSFLANRIKTDANLDQIKKVYDFYLNLEKEK